MTARAYTMNEHQQLQCDFRLGRLLKYGEKCMRQKFRDLYKTYTKFDWEDTPTFGQDFITNKAFHIKNWNKSQREALNSGNLKAWDITLLSKILDSIRFGQDVSDWDSLKTKIKKLKDVRNNYSHSGEIPQTYPDFNTQWDQAETSILFLGGQKNQIDEYHTCDIAESFNSEDSAYVNLDRMTEARKLREDATVAFEQGHAFRAIGIISKALELFEISNSERGLLYSTRSYFYLSQLGTLSTAEEENELLANATEDANSVTELLPCWRLGYYRLGKIYQRQKNWTHAITSYNQALALDNQQEDIRKARDECRFEANSELLGSIDKPLFLETSKEELLELEKTPMDSPDSKMLSRKFVFMGKCHFHGMNRPVDYNKARDFFERAADMENPNGVYCLGLLYWRGYGVSKDLERAVELFERATCFDDTNTSKYERSAVGQAQFALGACYVAGVVKPIDLELGTKLFEKAAANKNPCAAFHLGNFLKSGKGIQINLDEAIKCWKMAAQAGVATAMEALANEFLDQGDLDESLKWFDKCTEVGLLTPQQKEMRISEYVGNRKMYARMHAQVLGLGQSTSNLDTLLDTMELGDQVSQVLKLNSPGFQGFPSPTGKCSMNPLSCLDEIESMAKIGFKFTQSLQVCVNSWEAGVKLLGEYDYNVFDKTKVGNILQQFATSFRILPLRLKSDEIETLKKIVNEALTISRNYYVLDINARICQIILKYIAADDILELSRVSKEKHYSESFFHYFYCSELIKKEDKSCLQVSLESLKMFPDNPDLVFNRLISLIFISDDDNSIHLVADVHKHFLNVTPLDDFRVPESYYITSQFFLIKSFEHIADRTEGICLYKKGVEAEKLQISCFLPYPSSTKGNIEILLKGFDDRMKLESRNVPHDINISADAQCSMDIAPNLGQLYNDDRAKKVRNHRFLISCAKAHKQFKWSPSRPKSKQETIRALTNNVGQNLCVFFKTKFTIMEDPAYIRKGSFTGFIQTVAINATGYYSILYLYNFQLTPQEIATKLSFGSRIAVEAPEVWVCEDDEVRVVVNDPKQLQFLSNGIEEPKCRYCGKYYPPRSCGHCKKAKYCDETCQKNDWKILKHKLICQS